MVNLAQKKCVACEGGVASLQGEELLGFAKELGSEWKIINDHHLEREFIFKLEREFIFKDFKQALAFTNQVGAIAEEEGHHPDLSLGWGKVKITLWTHAVDGLSENDFILAAKINQLRDK